MNYRRFCEMTGFLRRDCPCNECVGVRNEVEELRSLVRQREMDEFQAEQVEARIERLKRVL